MGQTYFFVGGDSKIQEDTWNGRNIDQDRLQKGNAFTKRDDAHEYLKNKAKHQTRSGSAA